MVMMMMMMMMINTWLVGGKPLWCQLAILWAWPPTTGTRDYRSGRDLKSVNNKSSASVTYQRGLIEMSECRQWLEERFLSIQQDELSKSEGIMHIVITIIMHIRILRIDNFIKSLLWQYAGNCFLPMLRNSNSGVPEFLPVESGNQKCVNLESWLSVESGIQLKESGIPLKIGIRNPSSTDKNPESSLWSPESVAWNRQSKSVLDPLSDNRT